MEQPELTPEQEDRVRGLLAEARHTAPLPADVAARLDRVLADLGEERSAVEGPARAGADVPATEPTGASVVPLAPRRRRRLTPVLVAAAAVTVVGLGVPTLFQQGLVEDGGDAASTADRVPAAEAEQDAPGDTRTGSGVRTPGPAAGGGAKDASTAPAPSVSVSPGTADPQLRRLVLRLSPEVAALAGGSASPSVECAGSADWGDGDRVAVEYDGRLGALVYRAPEGQQQQVDLFLCGVSGPVRTVVVPLP